jgi:protein-S-isoprenylcysteine O-methyltransferase Ste14
MRTLRILLVYLFSMGLFFCVIPALTIGIGHVPDPMLGLPQLDFGPAMLILSGLALGLGLFWMAWSWYSLLSLGKDHPQEAFGVSLAPGTARLVTAGPFKYTRNPMVFGYLITLAGLGCAWRSIGASLITPVIGGVLFVVYAKLFEERSLEKRFGTQYTLYRHRVPLVVPRFWRDRVAEE